MGYKAEKEKVEVKKKGVKRILLYVLVFLLSGVTVFSFIVPPKSWKYYFAYPKIGKRGKGELRIHYLDVGQGDSTLIELPDGKVMLIDGGRGDDNANNAILRYLNALKISEIDYLVVTHTDSDHCGGLDEVLEYKKVLNAYVPLANATENEAYAEVCEALAQQKCEVINSSRSIDLSKKDGETPYTLSFLYPYSPTALGGVEIEGNATSAVVWLDYMGVSAIFCGDAPESVENKLVSDHALGLLEHVDLMSTELLKVAHHGSASSTSLTFLQYLGVKKAVISCGKDNIYNHPTSEVLARLAVVGAEVYRTDEKGHIVVTVSPSGEYFLQSVEK